MCVCCNWTRRCAQSGPLHYTHATSLSSITRCSGNNSSSANRAVRVRTTHSYTHTHTSRGTIYMSPTRTHSHTRSFLQPVCFTTVFWCVQRIDNRTRVCVWRACNISCPTNVYTCAFPLHREIMKGPRATHVCDVCDGVRCNGYILPCITQ